MMSRAESSKPEDRELLAEVFRRAGKAHVVGLTGVPGSGKSSLVRCLAKEIRKSGRTVGIVAIDPSSPYSGGSILGDRVRMNDLTGDDGVFIRSMATGGAMGGLARPAMDTVDVLDVAGFDVVLIETVGVGQDEVDVVNAAHTVIVV
ncbi:MAG: methylmalonyl Co-A mutase-associated GTPase MeaB, partial [Rhodospirillaceae bacterium]|nr:methylmalonyl Co-A mutase-associated GTPase MeaB [Rhodospirillaceae bacterium]